MGVEPTTITLATCGADAVKLFMSWAYVIKGSWLHERLHQMTEGGSFSNILA